MFASVPRPRARQLRALCRRVIVGNPASQTVRQGATAPPPELLGLFERTFTGGIGLGFEYRDRNGQESRRRIEPHGLLVEPPVWYILAQDLDRGAPRMFRMDRIRRPVALPGLTFRPSYDVVRAQITHLEGAGSDDGRSSP